ncbi:MAG: hypothetical protein IJW13_05575 [Clostridia bacterium]|nr:hypothetical protein [Clostridia bacterium]
MTVAKILDWYNGLPFIARLLIQIFGGYIVGGVYRILKFIETKNVITLVVGIIGIATGIGNVVVWAIDLVSIILHKKYVYFVD